MGRACYHPCESVCNRKRLDTEVNIHAVERFIGDLAIEKDWQFTFMPPTSGKHVLVVGSGPSGLSAAYHLRRLGHAVSIYEGEGAAGGMMRWGIPQYRLPRNVLDAEIARIRNMGVTFRLDTRVTDLMGTMASDGFDAAFLAVGAHLAKRAYLPAGDAVRIMNALDLP